MVAGACGVPGGIVLERVEVGCSIPFVLVTIRYQKMEASTAKAKGSSTALATLKSAPTPTVRDLDCHTARSD